LEEFTANRINIGAGGAPGVTWDFDRQLSGASERIPSATMVSTWPWATEVCVNNTVGIPPEVSEFVGVDYGVQEVTGIYGIQLR
jgi:hypothetical protein